MLCSESETLDALSGYKLVKVAPLPGNLDAFLQEPPEIVF